MIIGFTIFLAVLIFFGLVFTVVLFSQFFGDDDYEE